jgi:hypothetical protein
MAILSSLDWPSAICIGAMAATMVWLGNRAFAKARATAG